jgi:integrase
MPSYLQQRRRGWYAVLEIPKDLRPQFGGKPRFLKSLGTDSPALAARKVHEVIGKWQASLDRARAGLRPGDSRPADDGAYFRRALREATTDAARDEVMDRITAAADAIGYANADLGAAPSSSPEAREFHALATGALVPTLEHLDEWLSTSGSTAKTNDMRRSVVQRAAVRFPLLRDIDRPAVRRWVTTLMHEEELVPRTVLRVLSALRSYWRYLQTIRVVSEDEDPFSKLDVARQGKGRGTEDVRRPFEPADVPKLVLGAVATDDDQLADLIRLGMWTGCRIAELCALKVADVAGDRFTVREAKSAAGVRVVPIHAELQPTMARLIGASKDGFVLSGLTANKYGDRSNAIGRRFGQLRTALGFGTPLVFHSIRKTVVTILENAGVSENVVADIVGHAKPRITYGLYSGGATLEVKRAALAKLAYPAA